MTFDERAKHFTHLAVEFSREAPLYDFNEVSSLTDSKISLRARALQNVGYSMPDTYMLNASLRKGPVRSEAVEGQ